MSSNLTRKQLRRVEVLQALAPLTQSRNLTATSTADGYDLRQLADWVLQEGDFGPKPPVVEQVFTPEQAGAIGLTEDAGVEATDGDIVASGIVRSEGDGALWVAPIDPYPQVTTQVYGDVIQDADGSKPRAFDRFRR